MILGLLFTGGLWCCLGGFVGLLPEADAVGAGGREGSLLLAEPPPSAPTPLPDGNKRLVCVVEDVAHIIIYTVFLADVNDNVSCIIMCMQPAPFEHIPFCTGSKLC